MSNAAKTRTAPRPAEASLLERARDVLSGVKFPADWDAELYVERRTFRQVGWAEKKPEDTVFGGTQGMALRAVSRGRQGFAFSNEISRESLQRLWESARAASALLPLDKHRALPRPAHSPVPPFPPDARLFKTPARDLQRRLSLQEKRLLGTSPHLKKVLRLSLSESRTVQAVVNTRGVALEQSSDAVSFSTEVMGEKGGEVQTAWTSSQKRSWGELDVEAALGTVRERLLESFGAKSLPSGNYPVVFDPWVGVEFLELIGRALVGEAAQRGRSPWAGKKGREISSGLLTLIDDGTLAGGLDSAPYDDEGVPSRRNVLIDGGVLNDFLYDTTSAAREERESNGGARREGLQSPPSAGAGNLYMAPGALRREKLLAETGKAFWVREVLGMHTADAVSGDFSLGATGLLVEKGRVVRSVKGVTLAGNVADLLKKVDAVADDLTWHGSVGAPTFRVSSLSIGGA